MFLCSRVWSNCILSPIKVILYIVYINRSCVTLFHKVLNVYFDYGESVV